MKTMRYGMLGALALLLAASPVAVQAQSGVDWWDWALMQVVRTQDAERGPIAWPERRDRDADDRDDDDDDDRARRGGTLGDIIFGRGGDARDRGERAERDREDRGPKFCRNGEGHPVKGMEWCREKGFATGGGLLNTRWEDRGWDDIVLGAPRGRERTSGTVGQGGLLDILGEVVFGRMDGERRRLGGSEPMTGRWLSPGGRARVLQIRSGSVPVAELTDADGDGRVDVVLVPRPR